MSVKAHPVPNQHLTNFKEFKKVFSKMKTAARENNQTSNSPYYKIDRHKQLFIKDQMMPDDDSFQMAISSHGEYQQVMNMSVLQSDTHDETMSLAPRDQQSSDLQRDSNDNSATVYFQESTLPFLSQREITEMKDSVREVESLVVHERTTCSQFNKAGNNKMKDMYCFRRNS